MEYSLGDSMPNTATGDPQQSQTFAANSEAALVAFQEASILGHVRAPQIQQTTTAGRCRGPGSARARTWACSEVPDPCAARQLLEVAQDTSLSKPPATKSAFLLIQCPPSELQRNDNASTSTEWLGKLRVRSPVFF